MNGGEALGPGAEFDAIRSLVARWGDLAAGIGDDAATFTAPRGDQVVASVDASVEGKHFRREWLTPREIGYRAVAAAMSDLAAMAAHPLGVLIALVLPDAWRSSVLEIADGIGDAARSANTVIRGGNITAGSELSITTTVFGAAFVPLRRSGARIGDRVYVTGALGGPAAALRLLTAGQTRAMSPATRERFARPVPRLREAQWLADRGATAAIDLSDGLVGDLRHLASASGVAIDMDGKALPRFEGATPEQAAASGEEYELVVTTPAPFDAAEFSARFSLPLTEIGRVVRGDAGHVTVRGIRVADVPSHDHLSR